MTDIRMFCILNFFSSQEAATNAEYRLQRMEEIAEQTLSNLAVIHR